MRVKTTLEIERACVGGYRVHLLDVAGDVQETPAEYIVTGLEVTGGDFGLEDLSSLEIQCAEDFLADEAGKHFEGVRSLCPA